MSGRPCRAPRALTREWPPACPSGLCGTQGCVCGYPPAAAKTNRASPRKNRAPPSLHTEQEDLAVLAVLADLGDVDDLTGLATLEAGDSLPPTPKRPCGEPRKPSMPLPGNVTIEKLGGDVASSLHELASMFTEDTHDRRSAPVTECYEGCREEPVVVKRAVWAHPLGEPPGCVYVDMHRSRLTQLGPLEQGQMVSLRLY